MPDQRQLLDHAQMQACIERLADAICAAGKDSQQLAIVGLHRRGVPLAQRLVAALKQRACTNVVSGTIDITQYRDDLKQMKVLPKLEGSDIPFDMENAHVVLCDEVIYTGRTIRAGLNELLDFGRPARVQLAVLVERAGRQLPIQPDFVGQHVEAQPGERVCVRFQEVDGKDAVYVQPSAAKDA